MPPIRGPLHSSWLILCQSTRCRGFPTQYWWCWAGVGFVLATTAIIVLLLIAALTFIGGVWMLFGREAVEEGGHVSNWLGTLRVRG